MTPPSPRLQLEFSGQFPAPPADRFRHENFELLDQYLSSWTRTFGEPNYREDGDFENFVETMARFDAASRAFGSGNTNVLHKAGPHLTSLARMSDGSPYLPGEDSGEPDFVFGPVTNWGGRHHGGPVRDPSDRYWKIPAFKELSGRRWAVAGFVPDDPAAPDLIDVLQTMFDDGVRGFVVKGTAAKTLLVKFVLTARPTGLYDAGSGIPGEITDSVMHLEGHSEVFLVQERIPMVDEYRFFMAGNAPAAGAGCVEDFTPLDGLGLEYDRRVEGVRGSGGVHEDRRLVADLVAFAREAGALLHHQAPELGDAWILDVARNNSTGEFVVIELNPARNAGLYASDPRAWMKRVRDRIALRIAGEPLKVSAS